MNKKPINPKHWNLCTTKEIANFTGFTEQNIRDRYKNVEGKENLYNSFQAMTYIDKMEISEKELRIVLGLYQEFSYNDELLKIGVVRAIDG